LTAYTVDIYVLFDQIGDAEFKNEVKLEPEVVYHAIFAKNQFSGFSRLRILMIRLCSATTRSADRLVDRRRFGPPTWTGNRTATSRRTDSNQL